RRGPRALGRRRDPSVRHVSSSRRRRPLLRRGSSVRPGQLPLPCPHPCLSETTLCLLVRMPARAHAGPCACRPVPALEDRLGPIVPGQFFHARARRWHLPARGRCTVLTRRDTIEHSFSILYIRSEPVICAGLRRFEPPARP